MIPLVIVSFVLYGTLGSCATVESPEQENHRHLSKRIVGGSPIEIKSFPWIASIQTNNISFCVGSILTITTILTAAHCTNKHSLSTMSVRVGSSRSNEGGSVHKCVRLVVHENFTEFRSNSRNDVALITVDPPMEFSANVTRVSLPSKDYVVVPGTEANVAGWGRMSEEGQSSKWLMSTSLTVMINARCANDFGDSSGTYMDLHGFICTDGDGKGPCMGDSGASLVVGDLQIGIASWGRGCARPNYPGVYVNVAVYREWIEEKTGGTIPHPSPSLFDRLIRSFSMFWLNKST